MRRILGLVICLVGGLVILGTCVRHLSCQEKIDKYDVVYEADGSMTVVPTYTKECS